MEEKKSKAMSVLGIILASVGLLFLILSIAIRESRELFLSLGLASVIISNLVTTVWANKKKANTDENNK